MKSTPSRTSLQNKDKHFAALSIKVETLNDELVEHEEMNKKKYHDNIVKKYFDSLYLNLMVI